jgi:hypothetical protein
VAVGGFGSANKTVYLGEYQVISCLKYGRRVLSGRIETHLKHVVAHVVVEA